MWRGQGNLPFLMEAVKIARRLSIRAYKITYPGAYGSNLGDISRSDRGDGNFAFRCLEQCA